MIRSLSSSDLKIIYVFLSSFLVFFIPIIWCLSCSVFLPFVCLYFFFSLYIILFITRIT